MRAAGDAVLGGEPDGSFRCGEVVASVDMLQGLVIDALHTIFQHHIMGLPNLIEMAEQGLVDQVGTGTDDDADNLGCFQSLGIDALQLLKRLVGVGKRLEVGEIMVGTAVTALVERDAFLDLLADAFLGLAVGGVEGGVCAKGTASCAEGAVAVGAAESSVDADFLDTAPEQLRKIGAVAVESTAVEMGWDHGAKINKNGITRCASDPFPLAAGALASLEACRASPGLGFSRASPSQKRAFARCCHEKSPAASRPGFQ